MDPARDPQLAQTQGEFEKLVPHRCRCLGCGKTFYHHTKDAHVCSVACHEGESANAVDRADAFQRVLDILQAFEVRLQPGRFAYYNEAVGAWFTFLDATLNEAEQSVTVVTPKLMPSSWKPIFPEPIAPYTIEQIASEEWIEKHDAAKLESLKRELSSLRWDTIVSDGIHAPLTMLDLTIQHIESEKEERKIAEQESEDYDGHPIGLTAGWEFACHDLVFGPFSIVSDQDAGTSK